MTQAEPKKRRITLLDAMALTLKEAADGLKRIASKWRPILKVLGELEFMFAPTTGLFFLANTFWTVNLPLAIGLGVAGFVWLVFSETSLLIWYRMNKEAK